MEISLPPNCRLEIETKHSNGEQKQSFIIIIIYIQINDKAKYATLCNRTMIRKRSEKKMYISPHETGDVEIIIH